MSANDLQAALDKIKSILGANGYIADAATMQPYLTSWRNGWTGKAALIALPSTTAQTAEIVALCHRHGISIVPQGGNTGLVGGATPSMTGDDILINLSRMNKIREIDTVGATVTVESGVILQSLQETAAKAGFLFPLSMASEGSAHIGGAVSTNAGGTAVLRYGNMRQLVLGVEAVLPNGKIFSGLRKLPKDNAGYNLSQHFIGAEGTLGIVTAVTLRLFPAIQQSLTSIVAIKTPEAALELLHEFRREAAEFLSAFEIISSPAMKLVTKHIPGARQPTAEEAPYYLLIEMGASSAHVPLRDIFEAVAAKALEQGKALDAVIAESSIQAKQFWHIREHIPEAIRKEGPGIHFDISFPLAQIATFMNSTGPKIKALAPDIILAPFGHIGDGNLHYNMCFSHPPSTENMSALKTKIRELVYGEVQRLEGSISAEHGIGLDRKAELAVHRTATEMDMMRVIKKAVDPDNIMNPGKIF